MMNFNWLQLRSLNSNMVASCWWSGTIPKLLTQNRYAHILLWRTYCHTQHCSDVIMSMMGSQITSLTIVYSTVYSDADQRKHQSSASLAFVREIHPWPMNSPHIWPVTRKLFPLYDVIMQWLATSRTSLQCCERDRHDARELLITSKSHVGDVVIANSNFFAEKAE